MIVADTDVLVDCLRTSSAVTRFVERALREGQLATTAVTAFELWAGARGKRSAAAVSSLLGALDILPLGAGEAECAAALRRGLRDEGADIGMADSLIAGICVARGLPLLTRNLRHFDRVPDLMLVRLGTG